MPMQVILLNQKTGRSGAESLDSDHRYTQTWQALTNDFLAGPGTVLADPDVPLIGSIYRERDAVGNVVFEDDHSVLVSRRADQDDADNPGNWRLTYEYAGLDDPVSQPAEVEWGNTRFQKALIKDLDDVPVRNSAGDPFESGVMFDRSRGTVIITQNVLTWNPIEMETFRETTNLLPFLANSHPPGFPIGTAKMVGLTASRVRRSNNTDFYWRRRAEIEINLDLWLAKVRDAGYHAIYTRTVLGLVVPYKSKIMLQGTTPASPVPLAADGTVLPLGSTPLEKTFRGYEPADWTNLNLDY